MSHRAVNMSPRYAARRRQGGSFMLEALIGILIFSFGVLGLVGLQAQSMRHVSDAQYRGEAVYLANSLIARMWSDNPASLAAKYQSGGSGYDAFREMVKSLPNGADDANKPTVLVEDGPAVGSSLVTVQVFWNLPGEDKNNAALCGTDGKKCQHNYTTMAVVGLNP